MHSQKENNVVQPAQPRPFKQLQGYEAMLRQNRDFREMSFKTASRVPSANWNVYE